MEELSNTQLLRQIQDLTDEHEKQKLVILEECKKADKIINEEKDKLSKIEEEYNNYWSLLNKRMGSSTD